MNKAKATIARNMHKFPEHQDTTCYVCSQFSEGGHNPSVTAAGDTNTTVNSVFTFQHHLEALAVTCSFCAKIDKHNLRHFTFARSRIKAEFDKIMDINRLSIHPRPKKEVFCFTCRQGQGGGTPKNFLLTFLYMKKALWGPGSFFSLLLCPQMAPQRQDTRVIFWVTAQDLDP